MRELPIIFNTEMVKSILRGNKVCTRRPVEIDISNKFDLERDGSLQIMEIENNSGFVSILDLAPYQTGDLLYVRETFLDDFAIGGQDEQWNIINIIYRADSEDKGTYPKWKPSIHMPKKYARIWLKVTGVRVERVSQIDNDGCIAEGIPMQQDRPRIQAFKELWDSIYKNWGDNPWVWVIDFEVIKK